MTMSSWNVDPSSDDNAPQ